MMKHWVYRFQGDYGGLIEDMDRITRHSPDLEIINVQQIGDAGRRIAQAGGGYEYEHTYLIYTRRKIS